MYELLSRCCRRTSVLVLAMYVEKSNFLMPPASALRATMIRFASSGGLTKCCLPVILSAA